MCLRRHLYRARQCHYRRRGGVPPAYLVVLTGIGMRREKPMNLRYDGGPFAHGRRDTLHGPQSHVTDREYPIDVGFKRQRPRHGRALGACQHKSL